MKVILTGCASKKSSTPLDSPWDIGFLARLICLKDSCATSANHFKESGENAKLKTRGLGMQQRELQECDRHDCIRPLHGLKRARWHSSDSSRQNLEMVGENIYFYGFHISFNMQQTKSAQLLQQFRSANAHESTKICSLSSEPTLNTNLSFKRRRFHCNSKVRNSQKSCLSAKACSLDVSNGQP